MKKKQLFGGIMLLLLGISANNNCMANDKAALKVHFYNNGSVTDVLLSGIDKIVFKADAFSVIPVDVDGQPADYVYTDVKMLTFGEAQEGENSVAQQETESLSVYPNPATQVLYVGGWESSEPATISIFSAQGLLCKKIENWNGEAISVEDMEAGHYFIQVNKQKTFKFVKL